MMTKKHFEAIADFIKTCTIYADDPGNVQNKDYIKKWCLIEKLQNMFAIENPKFDRIKFANEACD